MPWTAHAKEEEIDAIITFSVQLVSGRIENMTDLTDEETIANTSDEILGSQVDNRRRNPDDDDKQNKQAGEEFSSRSACPRL